MLASFPKSGGTADRKRSHSIAINRLDSQYRDLGARGKKFHYDILLFLSITRDYFRRLLSPAARRVTLGQS
jgi:hypothetical protein